MTSLMGETGWFSLEDEGSFGKQDLTEKHHGFIVLQTLSLQHGFHVAVDEESPSLSTLFGNEINVC